MNPSLRRVWGLTYRHLCLFRRSWPRQLELAYWPTLDLLIWGLTAKFLFARYGASAGSVNAPQFVGGALLGGVLLWQVAMRSQIGMALSFMEEIWSRNLGHIFVSPLRPWELNAALLNLAAFRTAIGILPAILLAWGLYAFDVFRLGPVLVLFLANLMVMGWTVSFFVMSLILRKGQGAEAMAWSVMAGLAPLCAVYYPVHIIPLPWRAIALALPASHVFEGMRAALHGQILWAELAAACGLNALWLGIALATYTAQFRAARRTGALVAIGE